MRVAAIHVECGKPAFWFTREPALAEKIDASLVESLDGAAIRNGDPMECGSCRRRFHLDQIKIDE